MFDVLIVAMPLGCFGVCGVECTETRGWWAWLEPIYFILMIIYLKSITSQSIIFKLVRCIMPFCFQPLIVYWFYKVFLCRPRHLWLLGFLVHFLSIGTFFVASLNFLILSGVLSVFWIHCKEHILVHRRYLLPSTFRIFETSWASDLLAVIMLLHVSNWIAIWCFISLVCVEFCWVDGDGCGWGSEDWVTFVSNVTTRLFLSSGAMVLRIYPSMIALFNFIFLLVPVLGILSD